MPAQLIYYVYAYIREDGTPYYIGKGKGPRIDKPHWFPLPPESRRIYLEKNLSEVEALDLEVELIRLHGRKSDGGILINITEGGEGFSGAKHSEETKSNMSKNRKGKRFGGVTSHSEESRAKMSQSHKGKKLSEEDKLNKSKALKGKFKSEEHKRALRKPKKTVECDLCSSIIGSHNINRHRASCERKLFASFA